MEQKLIIFQTFYHNTPFNSFQICIVNYLFCLSTNPSHILLYILLSCSDANRSFFFLRIPKYILVISYYHVDSYNSDSYTTSLTSSLARIGGRWQYRMKVTKQMTFLKIVIKFYFKYFFCTSCFLLSVECSFLLKLFVFIIGYVRILLAVISFYFMPTDHVKATICYLLSGLLDAIDGHAARLLNQGLYFINFVIHIDFDP